MNNSEPLEQFLNWHEGISKVRQIDERTAYSLLKEAFYAGYAARPAEPRLPSRDALTDERREILRKYAPPQPHAGPSRETLERVQRNLHGRTVTDRPTPPPPGPDYKARKFAEAWGATPEDIDRRFGAPGPVPTPVQPDEEYFNG